MAIETLTAHPPRDAHAILADTHQLLEPALRHAVWGIPPKIRTVVGYHLGWWDEHHQPTLAALGKAIRPALAVLACQAVGGTATQAMPVAVAVEAAHNFSLLHDDVIDRDATRRGRPTAWSLFGIPAAILAGDALLTLAHHALAQTPAPLREEGPRYFSQAMWALAEGEYHDCALEQQDQVSIAEVAAMAAGKTGALLSTSCALGALAGGGDAPRIKALERFGARLGAAFQYVDDVLGIWGDPRRTGKPAHSDLYARKKTLPVAFALNSPSAAGRELSNLYCRPGPLEHTAVARVADLVEEAGGRTWALEQAEHYHAAALTTLAAADLDAIAVGELAAVADLVVHRDH
ncbi:polyprenyl synthetase family protein [Streptomyces sp. NPDC127051]|uniref:polyprenyl synthetase family protein n=1 Tax=Streptomyces sp. NPDC127051 TaxID=3347119 RepID=UPI0036480238